MDLDPCQEVKDRYITLNSTVVKCFYEEPGRMSCLKQGGGIDLSNCMSNDFSYKGNCIEKLYDNGQYNLCEYIH